MRYPYCPKCGGELINYDLSVDETQDQGYYVDCEKCGNSFFLWQHYEMTDWEIQDKKYGNTLDKSQWNGPRVGSLSMKGASFRGKRR